MVTVIEHRRVAGYRFSLDSPASARASVVLDARSGWHWVTAGAVAMSALLQRTDVVSVADHVR
jgi:hypothetical protein